MKFIKFLPHAGIIAILAGLMQFLDMTVRVQALGTTIQPIIAWAGFAAWACYFLAGCKIKGGLKVIGCWIAGVLASVVIIELGQRLTGLTGVATAGFPIAVAIIAFFVILFEKVPALDMIPAWFIGAACFFAFNKTPDMAGYKESVPAVLITCVVGQVFGIVTVYLRTQYGKMSEPAEAKPEPQES